MYIYRKWRLQNIINILYCLFKEPDCPRFLDSEGVSIPLILPGEELSQILFDIRVADGLLWNNVNILHDDTLGDLLNINCLSILFFLLYFLRYF